MSSLLFQVFRYLVSIAIQPRLTIFGPHIDQGGCMCICVCTRLYGIGKTYLNTKT
jgi:hypothetical protein